jgi:hypothetical protein
VLDRLIDRLPALLLFGAILICAHVAVFDAREQGRLIAIIPATVLFLLYLRAGSGAGGGAKGGKRKAAAKGEE